MFAQIAASLSCKRALCFHPAQHGHFGGGGDGVVLTIPQDVVNKIFDVHGGGGGV